MKRLPLILITALAIVACHNNRPAPSLKKAWIGSDMLQYLKINDTTASLIYEDMGYNEPQSWKQTNDSITFYYKSNFDNSPVKTWSCKISKLTDDTLILKPLSGYAKGYLYGKDSCVFIDSSKINDTHVKFQKIFFQNKGGSLPNHGMQIEIDSTRKVFYFGTTSHSLRPEDSFKDVDVYEGQLSKGGLDSLKTILQHAWLDQIPETFPIIYDAADFDFVFYYNNKKKECRGNAMPYFEMRLWWFMRTAYQRAGLKKFVGVHKFEKDYDLFLPPPPKILVNQLRVTPPNKVRNKGN